MYRTISGFKIDCFLFCMYMFKSLKNLGQIHAVPDYGIFYSKAAISPQQQKVFWRAVTISFFFKDWSQYCH